MGSRKREQLVNGSPIWAATVAATPLRGGVT